MTASLWLIIVAAARIARRHLSDALTVMGAALITVGVWQLVNEWAAVITLGGMLVVGGIAVAISDERQG